MKSSTIEIEYKWVKTLGSDPQKLRFSIDFFRILGQHIQTYKYAKVYIGK